MTAHSIDVPATFRGLLEPARYKAFHGGRGSGKSHAFATALLVLGGQKPLRILCGREVQNSIRDSVKQLLDDKIRGLGMGGFYHSLQAEIRGANGTQFGFAGLGRLTVDQIKSYEGVDIFWGEEAQTFSAYSLETLIPTIRKPGSELWFSWNPRHASDPVDRRFRGEAVPPDALVRRVNYSDNPFFPTALEKERLYDHAHAPARYGHIWLGEYEPMAVGAIWTRLMLHEGRRAEAPDLKRVLVAVDPAVSAGGGEHGIVVVAEGADGRGYVLDDVSTAGPPRKWAERAVAAYDRYDADAIVAETNQGGDMVKATLRSVRPDLPVIAVRASTGKHVRAEPISALYALGRISHVGAFPALEDQMCLMTAAGYEGDDSPDRLDALVWGFTELFPRLTRKPAKRRPATANNAYRPVRWREGR